MIIPRDTEIDRLYWLVARQHNIIFKNINFAEKTGTTIEETATLFLICRIIERIGDHVIKITKNVIDVPDKKVDQKK